MIPKWINIVNFLKGKPRKETLKTIEIVDDFDHREEKLMRDYEEDRMAEELINYSRNKLKEENDE